ncbi:STAS domain-containing protein [Oleidesulfovibrio sp.]|uniref:STAS domain-containing protein n=1 Tax=Oleidesulfovibrio sp. TaxID=2909707 RepID=UPI003A87CF1B
MNIVEKCMVVSTGENPDANALECLSKEILTQVRTVGAKGVLLNVSGLSFVDSCSFLLLRNMAKAVSMLGARFVLVGFQPGVASTAVDLGLDLEGLNTVRTMEDGLEMIRGLSGAGLLVEEQPETKDEDVPALIEESSDARGAASGESGV